jgi:hypothetical protein
LTTTATGRCSTAPAEALRNDDAGRSRGLGAAHDGAQVVRIGDLVETHDQRPLGGGELPRVDVAVRVAERDDALVVARVRGLGQLALGLDADVLDLGEPRLGRDRAFGRQHLVDLAAAGTEHLVHRAAAVDELAGLGHDGLIGIS